MKINKTFIISLIISILLIAYIIFLQNELNKKEKLLQIKREKVEYIK